ncbi:MAG: histidine phosphatase family protein [Betaproteobacteria bacterium]|nr:histidine phosphatase family protein [Betaproteobacteria bacterium]
MQATRIIAVRHGETAWNVATRIQGQLDIGLNARGRWQAAQVAQALRGELLQAVYASDLARAWDTAQAIAQASAVGLTAHTGLRERGFGEFEGLTHADIEARWPEHALRWRQRDPHWAPPNGESLAELRDRIRHTVDELASAHVGQQIVLVAHGGVLDALYRTACSGHRRACHWWAGLTPATWSLSRCWTSPATDPAGRTVARR